MNTIKILFLNNLNNYSDDKTTLNINKNIFLIKININNITNYNLVKEIKKISNLLNINNEIKKINIIFDNEINDFIINKIITKLSDILYSYIKIKEIKMYKFSLIDKKITKISEESINLLNELRLYKNIVMDPNKNPESYLEYIKNRIPEDYITEIHNLKEFKKFPLSYAVGVGSIYNSYFVHIKPKVENPNNITIYLLGKSVTYDSGGLNIKVKHMEEMKTDMAGSAIIVSVLNILNFSKLDNKYNIHLLIPIVENMIGNTSTRPGQVIKTYNSKTVEISNIDAEGRLCLADCLEYINKDLIINKDPNKTLIIDIATLTGNAVTITAEVSSIVMCNNKAEEYKNKLMYVSENVGEYLDYLKLRPEYLDLLKSPVADIKNINLNISAGCIIAGSFLHYFATDVCPWIHLDIAPTAFIKEISTSYGINLLVEFIKQI